MRHHGIMGRWGRSVTFVGLGMGLVACGGGAGENTGRSCDVPEDCYPEVDHAMLAGAVECLDRVESGYCTHLCETDADCCAIEGECQTGLRQVCAPFENSTQKRCFLSCEAEDIGDLEENEYCQDNAHRDFNCRSTGGGSMNRKVCVPGG